LFIVLIDFIYLAGVTLLDKLRRYQDNMRRNQDDMRRNQDDMQFDMRDFQKSIRNYMESIDGQLAEHHATQVGLFHNNQQL